MAYSFLEFVMMQSGEAGHGSTKQGTTEGNKEYVLKEAMCGRFSGSAISGMPLSQIKKVSFSY